MGEKVFGLVAEGDYVRITVSGFWEAEMEGLTNNNGMRCTLTVTVEAIC